MIPAFSFVEERARFEHRRPFLERHWAMRIEPMAGIVFQPETAESVDDQVEETLWVEGRTLDSIPVEEAQEVRASFEVLVPRREAGGVSIAASLVLEFAPEARDERLAALHGLPESLVLEMASGAIVAPAVDRGSAGPDDRLPSVLALRYRVPDGEIPVALVSGHAAASRRVPAPDSWTDWIRGAHTFPDLH